MAAKVCADLQILAGSADRCVCGLSLLHGDVFSKNEPPYLLGFDLIPVMQLTLESPPRGPSPISNVDLVMSVSLSICCTPNPKAVTRPTLFSRPEPHLHFFLENIISSC